MSSTSGQDATRHTPPIEALLLHIRKHFGDKGDTNALILRWADLAADEYLRLSDSNAEMLAALKFVDRLYSTIGGVVNPLGYGLIANSDECGAMINAVRDAIAKAENGQ